MKATGRTLVFVLAALAVAAPAWSHRYYASLAEVEYDADRKALEVALRVDDHNLEDALRLRYGADFRLGADAAGERHARDYIAEHFAIHTADGKQLELAWVGWEWSPGLTWLYFEFPVTRTDGLTLEHTLFLELSDRQINTVNVRAGEVRTTLMFDRKSHKAPLTIPPDC